MRILYSFPHSLGRPGIGTTAYHQVEGVIESGTSVVVCCTSLDRDVVGADSIVRTLAVGGRRLPHRLLGVQRAYRYHDRRAANLLRALAGSVDVVHAWPSAMLETVKVARSIGVPVAREVPNTHTAHAFAAVTRELSQLVMPPIEGHSHTFAQEILQREEAEYEAADCLLVPSEFALGTFIDRGVPRGKLVLHRYGFDPTRFYPDGPARVSGQRRDGLQALFVGSCEPRKGLHYALRAWIESGAAARGRFVICGDFVPGYREALASWLDHPSVSVSGFSQNPAALMRESDILIFPTVEEGSALVTYEAQACGCALVVSDAAGARCRHEREGLVHPAGDVRTLTSHLRTLDEQPELVMRLQHGAIENSRQLTWRHAGQELVDVYAGLAASTRRPDLAAT
jgi:glycosyltransferase involved in cell wall biosynthesis